MAYPVGPADSNSFYWFARQQVDSSFAGPVSSAFVSGSSEEKDGGNQLGQPARPRNRRPTRRLICCPAHPEQKLSGNGRKYYIHVLTAEELKSRGMGDKRARLVMQAYPVLVLSNEWLEELYCQRCGQKNWCHVTRLPSGKLQVSWAKRELWQQVAHVDPLQPNPTVSEFTRRQARRLTHKRHDGRRYWDPS